MAGLDVLIVGDTGSIHVRRLAAALAAADVRVGVAGFDPRGYSAPIRTYSLGRSASVAGLALAIPRLARVVRRTRPAVLNAHYVSSYGLMSALATVLPGRAARTLLVQTAWGTDLLVTARQSGIRRWLAGLALRRAALVTGDSDGLREVAAELAPGVPFHRFVFGPDAALVAAPRLPGKIMVSARRLDPDMRVPRIVRAFMAACAADPTAMDGWELAVAGDGRQRAEVDAARAGDPRVRLLGQLDPAGLHALLLGAHVAVSIPVSDATSVALLEALAAGVLPVVNDLPANREWVTPETGLIVSGDPDVEELSRALLDATRRAPDADGLRATVAHVTLDRQVAALVRRFADLASAPG